MRTITDCESFVRHSKLTRQLESRLKCSQRGERARIVPCDRIARVHSDAERIPRSPTISAGVVAVDFASLLGQ